MDFVFQIAGLPMIIVGLGLGLIGYVKPRSSTITGLGDLISTFFLTLFFGPPF